MDIITEKQVVEFLQKNPEFFDHYNELLSKITFVSPHGDRAISLPQRHIKDLRRKNKLLEERLQELIKIAKENEILENKIHKTNIQLSKSNSAKEILLHLESFCKEIFHGCHVAARVWLSTKSNFTNFQITDKETISKLENLPRAHCCFEPISKTLDWFGELETGTLKSFAYINSTSDNLSGGMVFASNSEEQFNRDAGTVYLEKLSDIFIANMSRIFS